jgi:hypothetical protein
MECRCPFPWPILGECRRCGGTVPEPHEPDDSLEDAGERPPLDGLPGVEHG